MVWDEVHTEHMTEPGGVLDVREVRARVAKTLTGALSTESGLDLGDIDLMICEIVTNAIRYSDSGRPGGGVWVTVLSSPNRVRIEVQDDGGTAKRPAIPDQNEGWDESGRGLMLVNGLADAWGTIPGRNGRFTVWFEVVR